MIRGVFRLSRRSDVLHKARVGDRFGMTQCGITFTADDPRFQRAVWCEAFLHYLKFDLGDRVAALCSHCRDRYPPWAKLRRMERQP